MARPHQALVAVAAVALGPGLAGAESPIAERTLPDFELHRTTGAPWGWRGCRATLDGERDRHECGEFARPDPTRFRLDAGGRWSGERSGGFAGARLGMRSRVDRFLQARSDVVGDHRSELGDHRARGRWGLGDPDAGRPTGSLEADLHLRHGDTRWKHGLDGDGEILDADLGVAMWWRDGPVSRVEVAGKEEWDRALEGRRRWWRNNALLVPAKLGWRRMSFRAAGGPTRRMDIASLASGIGLDFAEVYQPDGWLEIVGFGVRRARVHAPLGPHASPAAVPRDLVLIDLRLLSIDRVVAVDNFDMVALWDLGLGATWIRDAGGERAAIPEGRAGLVLRVWEHGTFGAAAAHRVRAADTADGMVADLGLEARAGFQVRRTGAELQAAVHRRRRLLASGTAADFSAAFHASWHIEVGGLAFGVEHTVEGQGGWRHQLGVFARARLASRSSAILH
jgi:hypothetical protein